MHRLFATVFAAVALLLMGGPALAAPPMTDTTTRQNVVETFDDALPTCEGGEQYTITTNTRNIIEHSTVFDDGRAHFTFTATGTFVATSAGLPSYTGTFAVWGGWNANGQVENGTFTFTVSGKGSDGSKLVTHVTFHANTTPTGAEFFFTRCHD